MKPLERPTIIFRTDEHSVLCLKYLVCNKYLLYNRYLLYNKRIYNRWTLLLHKWLLFVKINRSSQRRVRWQLLQHDSFVTNLRTDLFGDVYFLTHSDCAQVQGRESDPPLSYDATGQKDFDHSRKTAFSRLISIINIKTSTTPPTHPP